MGHYFHLILSISLRVQLRVAIGLGFVIKLFEEVIKVLENFSFSSIPSFFFLKIKNNL